MSDRQGSLPHIGAIHRIEDAGDIRAVVIEFVPGDTLADRLAARGPPPIDRSPRSPRKSPRRALTAGA
jgi:hypothetical protein